MCVVLPVLDEDDGGGEEGEEGEPCGDEAHAVGIVGVLIAAHEVGLYVDDVVLLEVEDGGAEEVLGADVHVVALELGAFLAHDEDAAAVGLDGEVAGEADGFEEGEVVARDGVVAGLLDFAEERDVLVGGVDGDYGVVEQAVAQGALDFGGHL